MNVETMEAELRFYWRLCRGITATRALSAPPPALADNLAEMLDDMSAVVECTDWPLLRQRAEAMIAPTDAKRAAL